MSRSPGRTLALLTVSAVLIAFTRPGLAAPARTSTSIWVQPSGDDAAPGTPTRPVASLHAARALARAVTAAGGSAEVVLRDGTYSLREPLVLGPEDSGVLWRADLGASPIVSGGSVLRPSWRQSTLGKGIFESSLDDDSPIDQLWMDDQPLWMARFPNRVGWPGLNVFDTWRLDHRAVPDPAMDPLSPDRIARWANPAGAYLHAMHPALWGGIHWRVRGVGPDGKLHLEGGTQNNRGAGLHPVYRFIENVREELDAPGEWFFDRAARKLYLIPPEGTASPGPRLVASRLDHLVELRGAPGRPAKQIRLAGIQFRHANRTFMETKEPLLRSDWTIYRGGALLAVDTEDCEILDCTFRDLGGNAIFVGDYNRRLAVRGSHITEVGGSGICFVGSPEAVRNPLNNYDQRLPLDRIDRTPGPKSDRYPADCVVEDSLIHRTGRVEKQTAGVEIAMAQSITVRHCSIYDLPRAAVNIGDGCWGGHVIEGCDLFDAVLETGDHGAFNSWGRDRYWENFGPLNDPRTFAADEGVPFLDATRPIILRNNRWRCDHGWDIDLDDGSSNYRISDNLCLNGGIKLREGFGRIVENNILVRNGLHPHVWYRFSGDIVRRNIFWTDAYQPALMHAPPWGSQMDENLVHRAGVVEPRPAETLARQSGRDEHSILADARFLDPARGDFRVRSDSPARKLGFKDFPTDQFGVRKASLRAQARTPRITLEIGDSPAASPESTWQGATVRTLSTIEDASSVGVALDRGGVLILRAPSESAAFKAGLREGDLLVNADGRPVRGTGDLAELQPRRLRVVRGQAERDLNQPPSP